MKKVKEYIDDFGYRVCEELNEAGKRDGLYRAWYPNGKLESEYYYKDDKLDGLHREWYPDGQRWCVCTYKDGNLDGLFCVWDEEGNLVIEKTYNNGVEVPEEGKQKT